MRGFVHAMQTGPTKQVGPNSIAMSATGSSNYARLLETKKRYDPAGLFFVHHGIGSEDWSADGFTRLAERR